MLPMISTSVRADHNPGDTFIGLGAQYIIERVLGRVNWLILNKFGQATPWDKHKDLIQEAGIVIYGGMPQYNNYDDWCMWYDKQLWEDIINPREIKVVSLAGGSGYPNAEWTADDFADHCYSSERTKILIGRRKKNQIVTTVRDPAAHALLNKLGFENKYMPCTATFATRHAKLTAESNRDLTILVPPAWSSVPIQYTGSDKELKVREQWLDIYRAMKKECKKVLVVCHWYSEYMSLREYIPAEDLFFTSDFLSLLKVYTHAHTIVSARLHGALPAYGIEGTKVVSVAIDTRGHATEIFPKIPLVTYGNLNSDSIIEGIRAAIPSEEKDFTEWLAEYDELISSIEEFKRL